MHKMFFEENGQVAPCKRLFAHKRQLLMADPTVFTILQPLYYWNSHSFVTHLHEMSHMSAPYQLRKWEILPSLCYWNFTHLGTLCLADTIHNIKFVLNSCFEDLYPSYKEPVLLQMLWTKCRCFDAQQYMLLFNAH